MRGVSHAAKLRGRIAQSNALLGETTSIEKPEWQARIEDAANARRELEGALAHYAAHRDGKDDGWIERQRREISRLAARAA